MKIDKVVRVESFGTWWGDGRVNDYRFKADGDYNFTVSLEDDGKTIGSYNKKNCPPDIEVNVERADKDNPFRIEITYGYVPSAGQSGEL